MRFYLTKESIADIKNNFYLYKTFNIIDIQEIQQNFKCVEDPVIKEFLINEHIENTLKNVFKKKNRFIIYSNPELNKDLLDVLKSIIEEHNIKTTYIYIDKTENPSEFYDEFDEIVFYPKFKKHKIIECEPIESQLFYWMNSLKIPKHLKSQIS